MTDEELQAAEARLAELNETNHSCRQTIEQCGAKIAALSVELQDLDLQRQKAEIDRRKVKAEYGELYEAVGQEKKRREAETATAES